MTEARVPPRIGSEIAIRASRARVVVVAYRNDRCAAVHLTQGVYAELVQHARRKTLFPQVSVLRVGDGDDTAVSTQDVVRLRRW